MYKQMHVANWTTKTSPRPPQLANTNFKYLFSLNHDLAVRCAKRLPYKINRHAAVVMTSTKIRTTFEWFPCASEDSFETI